MVVKLWLIPRRCMPMLGIAGWKSFSTGTDITHITQCASRQSRIYSLDLSSNILSFLVKGSAFNTPESASAAIGDPASLNDVRKARKVARCWPLKGGTV